jgi:hypothetical protein
MRYWRSMKSTHELLRLATIFDLSDGIAILGDYLEGEVFDVRLDFSIVKLATDEALSTEDGVLGVHRNLVPCGVSDETFRVGKGNIRGRCSVSLVVGNDFWRVVSRSTWSEVKVCAYQHGHFAIRRRRSK